MPGTDRTLDFKGILKEHGSISSLHKMNLETPQIVAEKEYLKEGYNILNHIHTLNRMLSSIRKPYLDISSRSAPVHRNSSRQVALDDSWANIRHLSNEEREQIDIQARTIISRCADRVKEMEELEKRRSEIIANKTNPLSRLIPARLRQDASTIASDFIAAHHASITWYLSRRLAEASQAQKEMQEERIKRQIERTRTFGGSGAIFELPPEPKNDSKEYNAPGSWSDNLIAATIGASAPNPTTRVNTQSTPVGHYVEDEDDDDDEVELSESQIQKFEAENADMLRSVQNTLQAVQQAESSLMDISALQMELVSHLTRQTEITDQLYEDAIATTSMVEMGNAQLREARRRTKDSRLFILIFLLGASFSILFLHYY